MDNQNPAAQATTDQCVNPATSAAMQQAAVAMASEGSDVNAGNRTVVPAAAGPLFPESILLKVSVAQKKKCQERGGHRGVNRWIKSLIDAA